jgi:hypothetical protein
MVWYSPTRTRTLLQIGLVAVIASLLGFLLLQRAERLAAETEALAFDLSLRALRNGAQIEALRLLAAEGNAALARLQGANPADWITLPKEQYLGVLDAGESDTAPRGVWYFDAAQRELVYIVRHREAFPGAADGRIRLRASLRYADVDGDGRFDPVKESASGVAIEVVEPASGRS